MYFNTLYKIFPGHNAPVTLLKLDPLGKILLSGDNEGRDRSIRLWDLSAGILITFFFMFRINVQNIFLGTSLAVYTPPKQITACELISNGKFVALALKNHKKLITLELKGGEYSDQATDEEQSIVYGNVENEAKIFDLKE